MEELGQADLLLHVADASNPRVEEQIQAVESILDQMEFTDAPRMVVLNKADAAPAEVLERLVNRYDGVVVSAIRPKTLPPLLERIERIVDLAGGWSDSGQSYPS